MGDIAKEHPNVKKGAYVVAGGGVVSVGTVITLLMNVQFKSDAQEDHRVLRESIVQNKIEIKQDVNRVTDKLEAQLNRLDVIIRKIESHEHR